MKRKSLKRESIIAIFLFISGCNGFNKISKNHTLSTAKETEVKAPDYVSKKEYYRIITYFHREARGKDNIFSNDLTKIILKYLSRYSPEYLRKVHKDYHTIRDKFRHPNSFPHNVQLELLLEHSKNKPTFKFPTMVKRMTHNNGTSTTTKIYQYCENGEFKVSDKDLDIPTFQQAWEKSVPLKQRNLLNYSMLFEDNHRCHVPPIFPEYFAWPYPVYMELGLEHIPSNHPFYVGNDRLKKELPRDLLYPLSWEWEMDNRRKETTEYT